MAKEIERLGVYVDGFNLYHGLHDWSRCQNLWLDLVTLAETLRPRSEVVHVHYFTAPVLGNQGAASRQANYVKALTSLYPQRLTVTNGRYQAKEIKCRDCQSTYTKYEEKETDVNIAVNIVADAASQRFDSMLVISADSDLVPAIKTAKRINPKLVVVGAFPPRRRSDELAKTVSTFTIGKTKIRESHLPEEVQGDAGVVHKRPAKWAPPTA